MFILSQDKKTIINSDNVTSIDITEFDNFFSYLTNEDVEYQEKYKIWASSNCLGIYKTEERAKEVLLEILDTLKSSPTENYYTMPKN